MHLCCVLLPKNNLRPHYLVLKRAVWQNKKLGLGLGYLACKLILLLLSESLSGKLDVKSLLLSLCVSFHRHWTPKIIVLHVLSTNQDLKYHEQMLSSVLWIPHQTSLTWHKHFAEATFRIVWLPIRHILGISERWWMEKWHSWHLDASTRGKIDNMKRARCCTPGRELYLLAPPCSWGLQFAVVPASCTHINSNHTYSFVYSPNTVFQECVCLLFVCSSLCAPWCLPPQNNELAWENLSTGGRMSSVCVCLRVFVRACMHLFCLKMHCNFDCISFITVSTMH